MTEDQTSLDAYAPVDIAAHVEAGGVAKANLDLTTVLALSILAGAFIALGANFATIVLTDTIVYSSDTFAEEDAELKRGRLKSPRSLK